MAKMAIVKFPQTINAGESMEIREPSYTAGENVNWCNHYEKQYGNFFKKSKKEIPYDPPTPLLDSYPEK